RARLAAVGGEVWGGFAVAGVEHVAATQAGRRDDLVHTVEHERELRARDDAVHDHVGRRDPAVGAERGLASLPEEQALGLALRRADLARPGFPARGDDALGLRLPADGAPVDLAQARRGGVTSGAACE